MKINLDNYADFVNTHNIILNDTQMYDKIYKILCTFNYIKIY